MAEACLEVRQEPRQVYFGKLFPLAEEQLQELANRELLPVETNILWQEQLNRELTESEMEFLRDVVNGWTGIRNIQELARWLDLSPKRLKLILKGKEQQMKDTQTGDGEKNGKRNGRPSFSSTPSEYLHAVDYQGC